MLIAEDLVPRHASSCRSSAHMDLQAQGHRRTHGLHRCRCVSYGAIEAGKKAIVDHDGEEEEEEEEYCQYNAGAYTSLVDRLSISPF